MNYDDGDWSAQVARKVRLSPIGGPVALTQLDGGVWAEDETADTSDLRARLGIVDRELPAERGDADVIV